MYKLAGKRKLGRKHSHRRALVNNQVRSLLLSGKVRTTTPKAKVLKANADSFMAKLATVDKETRTSMLNNYLTNDESIEKVTKYVSSTPSVSIVKVGFRSGDNAEMSKVTLVGFTKDSKNKKEGSKPKKESSKKDTPKEPEGKTPDIDQKKSSSNKESSNENLGKSLKGKFSSKERARTRSGL